MEVVLAARVRKARYRFDYDDLRWYDTQTGDERKIEKRRVSDREFLGRWMAIVRKNGYVEEMVKTYPWMKVSTIRQRISRLRVQARKNNVDIPTLRKRPRSGTRKKSVDWSEMQQRHGLPSYKTSPRSGGQG